MQCLSFVLPLIVKELNLVELGVYAIHDSKAGAYLPPLFIRTRGLAERSFRQACADPGHDFFKSPGDFAMVYFGTFDSQSGKFDLVTVPEVVLTGLDVKDA